MSKKSIDTSNNMDVNWKVLKNRILLSITDPETKKINEITFKFSTTEQARVLAQYLRRSLSAKQYSYEIQFMTPEGFLRTPGVKPTTIDKSDEQFSGLTKIRRNESVGKLEVRLFRSPSMGGNYRFTMYFASLIDLNIAQILVTKGLFSVYKLITPYYLDKHLRIWREIEPYRFCDERMCKEWDVMSENQRSKLLEAAAQIRATIPAEE